MNKQFKIWPVLRDALIVTTLTCLGGFIVGFASTDHTSRLYVYSIGLSNSLFCIIGFTISGCLAVESRWRHLAFAAAIVWVASIFNVIFFSFPIVMWMASIVAVAIFALIGGGISLLFKRKNSVESSSAGDERFYDEVARELQDKPMIPGLWTKAFAETGGNDAKARALYIKFRVAQMAEASQRRQQESQHTASATVGLSRKHVLTGVVIIVVCVMALLSLSAWQNHKTNNPSANLPAAVQQLAPLKSAEEVENNNRQQFEDNKIKAQQGNAVAQYNLGIFYWKGQGVASDWTETMKWIRMSAEQGYLPAQVFLADRLSRGNGAIIKKDEAEAAKWYLRAAKQNDASAQMAIGNCYHAGQGVAKNLVEAYKWNKILAFQGKTSFGDSFFTDLTSDQKAEAERLAREFKPQNESTSDNSK